MTNVMPAEPQDRSADAKAAVEGTTLRLCIVSRVEKEPDEMIRFVVGPDDVIVPDLSRKLPGRGVWVTATRRDVTTAVKSSAFAKSLKRNIKAGLDLPDLIERLMLERTRSALSFANKAGLIVTGYMKVDGLIAEGRARVLVQAADGADDGIGRLQRKYDGLMTAAGQDAPIVRELTSHDLGLAIGRVNVIHAALTEGGQTRSFLRESLRLRRYRLSAGETETTAPDIVSGPDRVSSTGQAS